MEEEGQEILRAYGFPLPASKLAKSKKERNPLSKPIGLLLTGLAIASVLYAGKKTAN